MMPALAFLLHGDGMDIIYFWSSIFMIALPITVFGVLTYFVIKKYRNRHREQGAGSREP